MIETQKDLEPLNTFEKIRTLIQQVFAHPSRVAILGTKFAIDNNLIEKKDIPSFFTACLGHDLGKTKIPKGLKIILKNGKLNSKEAERVKIHPTASRDIFNKFDLTKPGKIVKSHHEKWDGSGYPQGLKGNEIPKESQIQKITDSFDVMIAWRGYNNVKNMNQALAELRAESGKDFAPEFVEPFCEFVEKNRKLIKLLLLKFLGAKSKRNFSELKSCPNGGSPNTKGTDAGRRGSRIRQD